MPSLSPKPALLTTLDQGLAAWVADLNDVRRLPLYRALDALQGDLDRQDLAAAAALRELDWVRDKIGSPEHLLGSDKTKHGEIAEIAEVGVRNARDLMVGRPRTSYWSEEGAGRIGPTDYGIDGVGVQSKFLNGLNNSLRAAVEHAERYPDEYGAGAKAYLHLPKDQVELLLRIQAGHTEGLSAKTVRTALSHVRTLEDLRGQPADEFLRPSTHTYAEVQQGRIGDTLDGHERDLQSQNLANKERTVDDHRDGVEAAEAEAAPTLSQVGHVAATGAAVGAGLQITVGVYRKWKREGRRPTAFTAEDWQEIGGSALNGAITGSVSAVALYGLTNYSALSAPFAGAVVSSGRAMATLAQQYQSGEISFEEFSDLGVIVTAEAGIAAAGAVLGQTLIPVPILGAVIGSSVARLASELAKGVLGEQSAAFAARLAADFADQAARLTAEHQDTLADLEAQMGRLASLADLTFDVTLNAQLLLLASVANAEGHGVPSNRIVVTTNDVDAFIFTGTVGRPDKDHSAVRT